MYHWQRFGRVSSVRNLQQETVAFCFCFLPHFCARFAQNELSRYTSFSVEDYANIKLSQPALEPERAVSTALGINVRHVENPSKRTSMNPVYPRYPRAAHGCLSVLDAFTMATRLAVMKLAGQVPSNIVFDRWVGGS